MSWAGSTTWCSYTEEQIRQIIAEADRGQSAAELSMRYQVPEFVIRGWQTRYGGKGGSALDCANADGFEGREELMNKLGKFRTGKVCVYIKKLEDIDTAVLKKLIRGSMEHVRAKYMS